MRAPVRLFGIRVPGLAYDISISDPAFAALLHVAGFGLGSYSLFEALRNPAFYRGVAATAGTIASLPLKTYRMQGEERIEASSFLDSTPTGPYGWTPFTWKEQIVFHLMTEGECGLIHVFTEAGTLCGLVPVSPTSYTVAPSGGGRRYQVQMSDGQPQSYDDSNFTQILGMSLDGVRGISPVVLFQRGIQLGTAMEIAAMRTMTNGMHISGLVAPKDEDLSEDDAKALKMGLDAKVSGPDNAGGLAMVNKRLVFTPWTQSNQDAQFEQGRRFQREEVALMLGMPIYKLNPEKQSSWGTGVSEQNAGWARETLMPLTSRIEEAVSPLLSPSTKFVEFDYKGLLQGTPTDEVKLILEQLTAGIMSEEEVREFLGLGPKDPGDTFREPVPVGPSGKIPMEPAVPKPVQPESEEVASTNGTG
jgi:HK97 family phage portal protein